MEKIKISLKSLNWNILYKTIVVASTIMVIIILIGITVGGCFTIEQLYIIAESEQISIQQQGYSQVRLADSSLLNTIHEQIVDEFNSLPNSNHPGDLEVLVNTAPIANIISDLTTMLGNPNFNSTLPITELNPVLSESYFALNAINLSHQWIWVDPHTGTFYENISLINNLFSPEHPWIGCYPITLIINTSTQSVCSASIVVESAWNEAFNPFWNTSQIQSILESNNTPSYWEAYTVNEATPSLTNSFLISRHTGEFPQ